MKIYAVNENPPPRNANSSAIEKLEALLKDSEQKEAARYGKKTVGNSPQPGRHGGMWWNKDLGGE